MFLAKRLALSCISELRLLRHEKSKLSSVLSSTSFHTSQPDKLGRFDQRFGPETSAVHGPGPVKFAFRSLSRDTNKFQGIDQREEDDGTVRGPANYVPLTPLSFLERSAVVYADQTSVVYGHQRYTWRETRQRCLRLASALTQLGISRGDVVAVLAPNVPAIYELHFSVPMAGAILCTLNIRYDTTMVSVLLKHSGAKVLFVDHQLLEIGQGALELLSESNVNPPLLVTISDPGSPVPLAGTDYESLVLNADPQYDIKWPADGREAISVNYTSGTTSKPKGVIYTHRGAYLNAKVIFDSIALHKVTHMGGAPTLLNSIVNSPACDQKPLSHRVAVMTGGSAPPPRVLFKMEELGFNVTHIYGLTETYGPATVCTWKPEWDSLPAEEQAMVKSRQGLHHTAIELDVKDPVTMESVTADGKTMGEVMFRGNTVMAGYFEDWKATGEALAGGWFRSGDLAVRHADGYIQLKDRSKDIIISGGENISTIEVETVLYEHPAVLEAAVVARPDEHWGETPCAFVKLKEGCQASSEEIVEYCRDRLPRYMAPKTVVFEELPKTATGKVQKFVLREKAKVMGSVSSTSGRKR